jgi:predicted enzyme involved in methoxymalonyl-ACP biosynthesis
VDRICRDAAEAGCVSISAEYIPTAKNNLVADFWDRMEFKLSKIEAEHKVYKLNTINYKQKRFECFKIQ